MKIITLDMVFSGPIIELFAAGSAERERVLIGLGESPGRRPVRALIDSGAGRTCLERSVIEAMDLRPAGETDFYTASSGTLSIAAPTCKIRLFLQRVAGELLAPEFHAVEVADLSGIKVDMLLGRDVLDRCLLVYNGPEKKLTLAFEPPPPDE